MTIILDLNESSYNRGIDYLKSISIMGRVVDGYQFYQIDPKVGRGLVKADPVKQTIRLEDNVDSEIAKALLNATKRRTLLWYQ